MGDETPPANPPAKGSEPPPPEPPAEQPPKTEIPPEVAAALKKANKEAETLRLKLKEIEDKDKSEAERNTEARATAEKAAAEAQTEVRRLRVAIAKKLPAELADRLRGDTEEEMSADADALLKAFGPAKGTGSFEAGPRGSGAPAGADMNALIRRSAGRG